MRVRVFCLALLGLGLVPAAVHADVKPNAICSEGMVLQQKINAKIWGTADKGEKVTIRFRGAEASVKADDEGRWLVEIPAGNAGGPFEMVIAGNNTITYKDILVGEVWVCSGQSNMEWTVGGCDKGDKDYATAAPPNPMLRTFHVKRSPQGKPQTETGGTWIEAKPQTVLGFTACGYFFGRKLQEDLKVPVGLINSSWGGTRVETWISGPVLEPFEKPNPNAKPNNPNNASYLYNGMIHPILNYRIKGAIWYQGESNAGNAFRYRTLFPLMITSWRQEWKQPDFPFFFVQLAPFTAVNKKPGESSWAELREAQSMTLALRNTGMAVITDFGNEYDIHPTPKRPVGERLALAAEALTYGKNVVFSGPVYKDMRVDGKTAILNFTHVGGGLVAKELVPTLEKKNKAGVVTAAWRVKEGSQGAPLVGFTMCGKDKVFHNANAKIVGDTVVVTCDQVNDPVAVRYGWANHPVCNLFNRDGLPASPFRTDHFPIANQPKQ